MNKIILTIIMLTISSYLLSEAIIMGETFLITGTGILAGMLVSVFMSEFSRLINGEDYE